jgi:hypothetical protein
VAVYKLAIDSVSLLRRRKGISREVGRQALKFEEIFTSPAILHRVRTVENAALRIFDPLWHRKAREICDGRRVGCRRAAAVLCKVGGDFAGGVIAYEGTWLGGDIFVSFEKKAVALLSTQGHKTRVLS